MRSNAAEYALSAPPTLEAVLGLLAAAPGRYTPMAGGTELMVALCAGRLASRELLSIRHLNELRFVEVTADAVTIGAGTTFTDLRRHAVVAKELPLLVQAASWTGSIANQNRGTLGGNIVNASPAADSSPALLVYEAEVTLISAGGRRTVPYGKFHLGYKKTVLRPEELVLCLTLRRGLGGWAGSIRKVGARNAQAISKVAFAGLARMEGRSVAEIRLAAASLRDRPVRLEGTEAALTGRTVTGASIAAARAALAAETRPIDDIRSTAGYRSAVAANLLEEFLSALAEK